MCSWLKISPGSRRPRAWPGSRWGRWRWGRPRPWPGRTPFRWRSRSPVWSPTCRPYADTGSTWSSSRAFWKQKYILEVAWFSHQGRNNRLFVILQKSVAVQFCFTGVTYMYPRDERRFRAVGWEQALWGHHRFEWSLLSTYPCDLEIKINCKKFQGATKLSK